MSKGGWADHRSRLQRVSLVRSAEEKRKRFVSMSNDPAIGSTGSAVVGSILYGLVEKKSEVPVGVSMMGGSFVSVGGKRARNSASADSSSDIKPKYVVSSKSVSTSSSSSSSSKVQTSAMTTTDMAYRLGGVTNEQSRELGGNVSVSGSGSMSAAGQKDEGNDRDGVGDGNEHAFELTESKFLPLLL